MKRIKNFIANLPIYAGLALRMLSDFFMTVGFRVHITLNTEAGVKLKQVESAIKKLAEDYHKAGQQKPTNSYNKLADIIKGNPNGSNSGSGQV